MAMAEFRNRLVHIYRDVDDLEVHEYLRAAVEDLESLHRAVASHQW